MTNMGQSRSKSQSCTTAVFNGGSTNRGENRRSIVRLNRARQLGISRQRIVLVEATIAGFDRTGNELELWIKIEQNRSGIHDPAHFAYSTSATSMTRRRDALMRSRETLMRIMEDLKRRLGEVGVHA
jgi:flagellar protein FliJ